MGYKTIIYRQENAWALIWLNRPHRMNAVIEEMYREIQDALKRVADDASMRSLILTGCAFEKKGVEKQAFCAGADLKKHAAQERSEMQKRAYIELAHETTKMIYEFPKPVIAAVNGPARGAGAEMALNADFVFMAETATIAFPETGLGTFVGGGVSRHLPEIVGLPIAKELVYTGKIVDGKTSVEIGLALRCYPVETLLKEARNFAHSLAKKAPVSLRLAKEKLQASRTANLKETLDGETEAILACMKTKDWREGIRAFAEKREPVYRGM